jgi:adenosylhomocysteine nucleosidase
MRILLAHALQEECGNIALQGHDCRFCTTGMGKVQAALAVEQALLETKPDLVINLGSAGALHHQVGNILLCSRFIDRDMKRVAISGICDELDFTAALASTGWFADYSLGHTVSTGDSFVISEFDVDPSVDVVDMEAFAIASACHRHGLPFLSVKYVTDIVGQNSVEAWTEKLAHAKQGLEAFMNALRIQAYPSHPKTCCK